MARLRTSQMNALRSREAGSEELRCAVCHDSAAGASRCERCGTWVHDECRTDGRCPTLGCVAQPAPPSSAAPYEQPDPNDWRPLVLVLPLLAGLLLYRPGAGPWAAVAVLLLAAVCFGALLVDRLRGGRLSGRASHPAFDTVGWGPRLAVGVPIAWGLAVVFLAPALGIGDHTCLLAFCGVPVGIALAHLLDR